MSIFVIQQNGYESTQSCVGIVEVVLKCTVQPFSRNYILTCDDYIKGGKGNNSYMLVSVWNLHFGRVYTIFPLCFRKEYRRPTSLKFITMVTC